ncbi:hypothetical protein CUMW_210390 [Citrus unshiu]|uniref:Uncharacterized protein n=1 Tax=Citrus unshiu TaxID=55188 RepID=A0A2H5QA19_CITUN|nr:hypothetical protein CUMW_210390 [Citrus unshiu]
MKVGGKAIIFFKAWKLTSNCLQSLTPIDPELTQFRTRQSPFGKGHQIFTFPYFDLLKLAEIIFEQLSTRRDLRDGDRLPTSRDSSVAGSVVAGLQQDMSTYDNAQYTRSREMNWCRTSMPLCVTTFNLNYLQLGRQSNLRKGNKGTALVDFYLSQGTEAER